MPKYDVITDRPLTHMEVLYTSYADENVYARMLLMAKRVCYAGTRTLVPVDELEDMPTKEFFALARKLAKAIKEDLLPAYRRVTLLRNYRLPKGQKPS